MVDSRLKSETNSEPFNILISSAGRRIDRLNILRDTLVEMNLPGKIVATDITRAAAAFIKADAGELVPRCKSADFIPVLLDVCRKHAIRLVVPTIDDELPILAAHRDEFAKIGTTLLVSSPEAIAIADDKIRGHAWFVEQGFPTVRETSVDEALANRDDWPFPLLVKPRYGRTSVGVAIVDDEEQFRAATVGEEYLVQTIAPGDEYTIDVLVNRAGQCVCAVPRKRIEVRAGEVVKGIAVRNSALESLAAKIAEALPGAYGPLNIQIFLDSTSGAMNVIEINPRFGGGYPLSWNAGARFPQWIIEEILGLPSTAAGDSWQDGLMMLRYLEAVFTPTIGGEAP